jgi:indoleacetamide hydrolase
MKEPNANQPALPENRRWRDLNAFINVQPGFDPHHCGAATAPAPTAAKSPPLAGWSLAIKDNIEVAGLPCTCGTSALRGYIPSSDAPAIARLRAAGAVVAGKANMHELAYGITSNNAAFGPVRNAFDPDFFAGGSSGGTAVAIAAGVVRAGLGTDTGGSSRIPAALNGIVGFRPSPGRYPMAGVARISPTRDVIGPMGRNVHDVAVLDAVLSGEPVADTTAIDLEGLRLGLPEMHFQEGLHVDVRLALQKVVTLLRGAGVQFVRADIPHVAQLNAAVSFPIVLHETRSALQTYLSESGVSLSLADLHASIASPDVKILVGMALSGHVSASEYELALHRNRPRLQRVYREYFALHRVAAILFPTTPLPACPIAGSDQTVLLNGTRVPTFATFIRNTDPASNAGIPALSLPAGLSSTRLPIGIELDGPTGADRRLLAIGAAIEAILNTTTVKTPGHSS